ncbi:MAG: hypothetical protein ACTTJA_03485 [Prevotella multiformis]
MEIKAHALAWYDCPESDGLAKGDKLKDKMQERKIETMLSIGVSFRLRQTTYSHVIGVCKYFCAAQS